MANYREGSGGHPLGEVRSIHRAGLWRYLRSPVLLGLVAVTAGSLVWCQAAVATAASSNRVGGAALTIVGLFLLLLVPSLIITSEVSVRERGLVIRNVGCAPQNVRFDAIATVHGTRLRFHDGKELELDSRLQKLPELTQTIARELG